VARHAAAWANVALDLARPSLVLPPPGMTRESAQGLRSGDSLQLEILGQTGYADDAAPSIQTWRSDLEVSRLSSVKYDASEETACTMILFQTCMPCRRPQRLPSYEAGYADLSNSS
jgi:hypothetical protein